ncbi:hypothetical protein [Mycoplasmopsis cynos]|nr:hypothetical protein [Mycoplasmopsis cynos]WQQ18028.1 hypothetical protein RRG56_01820 [Mycoplasmopsis cynos]
MLSKRRMYNLDPDIQSKTGKSSKKVKIQEEKKKIKPNFSWIKSLNDDKK